MTLKEKWNKHLKENSMTYCEHWRFAVGHGVRCVKAGIYLFIHGFCPCWYRKAGTKLVHKLEKEFTEHENVINK
tara:strand:+ start:127 stop:348 length:222 start_codon:yes stop_codon:yes gene_type:complete